MAAILGDEGVGTATIPPPAGPEEAASSREEIDFKEEADARGMRLVSCIREDGGRVSLTLDLGKGRQFALSGVPGRGPFSVSTVNPFLLDGLFVENLEEIQSQAKRIQTRNRLVLVARGPASETISCAGFLEVMSAAAEVHMCISGEGDEDDDAEGGDEMMYEYDFGGVELMMDDDGKAKRASSAQEGGSVYEDTDISKMFGRTSGGTAAGAGDGVGVKSATASNQNMRLMRDLSRLMRSNTENLGFSLQLKNDDALNEWSINLFGFADCALAEDMKRLEKEKKLDHVRLLMTFKADYPFSPPFVRVMYPRFKRSTGYIIDGAFCMELLTNQGWTPTNDIESVVVQIRAQMVVGKARIDFDSPNVTQPYPEDRAKAAFRSAAKLHKWAIADP